MTAPDPVRRFQDAQTAFDATVAAIGAQQWQSPTPCTEWDVRAVVNHLVNEQLWATPMLQGQTIEQVGDRFDGDLLGDKPLASWRGAAKESMAAVTVPGALDGTINSSMGPSPARQYLTEMTCDLIVHRWDLAQGIGREDRFTDDELDQLAEMVDGLAPMQAELEAAGIFASPLATADDDDRQTRLLAAVGRAG